MKISKLIHCAWNMAKNGTDKQQLTVIYTVAILASLFVLLSFKPYSTPDTFTYFSAGELFWNGVIDMYRTPIYPIICHMAQIISGQYATYLIFLIQLAAFHISIYLLYKLTNILIAQRVFSFCVTFFYGCMPHFLIWTSAILTESLSTSMLIALCYIQILTYKTNSMGYSILCFLLTIILLFLRPIFVFLVPIVLFFWLYGYFKANKTTAIINIISIALIAMIYCVYCKVYENKYGIFSASAVSLVNQRGILSSNNLLTEDTMIGKMIQKRKQEYFYGKSWYICTETYLEDGNLKAFQSVITNNIRLHRTKYLACTLKKIVQIKDELAIPVHRFEPKNGFVLELMLLPIRFLKITFFALYVLLFIYGIFFIALGIKQRHFPVLSIFMWLIVFANVFTAIVGAGEQFARLVLPCMPIFLVLSTMFLDYFFIKIRLKSNNIVQ